MISEYFSFLFLAIELHLLPFIEDAPLLFCSPVFDIMGERGSGQAAQKLALMVLNGVKWLRMLTQFFVVFHTGISFNFEKKKNYGN